MNSKPAIKTILICFFLTVCNLLVGCSNGPYQGPYQSTGIKVGEVTDSTAIVWARLTRYPERTGAEAGIPEVSYYNTKTGETFGKDRKEKGSRHNLTPTVKFPEGKTVDNIEGAVPGASGKVRVRYKTQRSDKWKATTWREVDPQHDYTCQIKLAGLESNARYRIQVEAKANRAGAKENIVEGGFRTAPRPDQPERVVFTVSTGQAYGDQDAPSGGYKIYPSMLKLDPSFFVHTGDIIYYDKMGKSLPLARWHWARMYSLPTNMKFHRQVSGYFIKDDHDTLMDDCWPGMKTGFMGDFTFEQGQMVFLEQVPMSERTWRTFRWGKDLQIWLVEGRDFRSPNPMPDGPEKTIWGKEQKSWFKRTVRESDATFRILISPTPLVGPDRTSKNDNHANKGFAYEGNELRQFISKQKNMFVVCGDRHWQYVSVDTKTGLREYSCGPASDKHAGGWSNDKKMPEHRYLNVVGGFLAVIVEREEGEPTLVFRYYSVDGEILYSSDII